MINMGLQDVKIEIATAPCWRSRNQRLERLKSTAGTSKQLRDLSSSVTVSTLVEPPKKRAFLSLKLYRAATKNDVDHFIGALEETSAEMKLNFSEMMELVSPMGNTLLHVAAREGREEIVRLLAYHSPFLFLKQNLVGDTALHVAVKAGHNDVVSTLVRFREDNDGLLRVRNNRGNTALHERLISKHKWFCSTFMEADPEICYFLNDEGKSPLYLAAEAGDTLHLRFILHQMMGKKEEMLKGKSPVLPAISTRNKDILDVIISNEPAFINLSDEEGKTPLHFAASIGYIDIVQYLLCKDVECSLKWDNNGFFPIHIAAVQGHLQVVEELLRHCPDPREMLTQNGRNILHIVAATGNNRIVRFILKCPTLESLINEVDYDGNTPLHLATMNWHPKIVTTLTWDKRVNLGAVNNEGFTALDAVEYYMEKPGSFDKRFTRTTLKAANAPRAPKKDSHKLGTINSTQSNTSHIDKYKDRVNSLLLVATLVATVTFAAGFTMPGGYNNSDPNQGMATMLQKRAFYVFVFCDTIAMYSSILVAISLIWAQLGDINLVLAALQLSFPLLGVSLAMMSLAFMAAVYIVVSNLDWLAYSVLIMGSAFFCAHLAIFLPLFFPISTGNFILRYISYYPLQLLILLTSEDNNAV